MKRVFLGGLFKSILKKRVGYTIKNLASRLCVQSNDRKCKKRNVIFDFSEIQFIFYNCFTRFSPKTHFLLAHFCKCRIIRAFDSDLRAQFLA